jgi:hypothetical protein
MKMAAPFTPEEIDDLDETLLDVMDAEEMAEFREQLEETLDDMYTLEPDPDEDEEAYYEWEDRMNVLHDLMEAIDDRTEQS